MDHFIRSRMSHRCWFLKYYQRILYGNIFCQINNPKNFLVVIIAYKEFIKTPQSIHKDFTKNSQRILYVDIENFLIYKFLLVL